VSAAGGGEEQRGGGEGPAAHQAKALSPVRARPMISFWIWLVPS
jgi:hypothetical protein